MEFHQKYTTANLISEQKAYLLTIDPKDLSKDFIFEESKIILSNDAYAICEFLETLNNRMVL